MNNHVELKDTISQDIGDCVRKWYMSKDYETVKITDSKASMKVKIGTVCYFHKSS